MRERDFAVAGQGCTAPKRRGRQIGLSGRRWESATPIHDPWDAPPCRSRSMPIAVTTFPSSGIG